MHQNPSLILGGENEVSKIGNLNFILHHFVSPKPFQIEHWWKFQKKLGFNDNLSLDLRKHDDLGQ